LVEKQALTLYNHLPETASKGVRIGTEIADLGEIWAPEGTIGGNFRRFLGFFQNLPLNWLKKANTANWERFAPRPAADFNVQKLFITDVESFFTLLFFT